MNSEKFFTWCRVAVKGIKYRPDRDEVHKELYEHLEDRYESFVARGWAHEEAIDKTLEAMGSAEELAPQLAKIHRPFWPYMLIISRVILIIVMLITIIPFGLFLWENTTLKPDYNELGFPEYEDAVYQDEFQHAKRLLYLEPGCSAKTDGYSFTVTKAALWEVEYVDGVILEYFTLRIEITNPRPWASPADVENKFWIEDSLGNQYPRDVEASGGPQYSASSYESGIFTSTCEIVLRNYISQEAEWINIGITSEGREFVIRVDLTGGENT